MREVAMRTALSRLSILVPVLVFGISMANAQSTNNKPSQARAEVRPAKIPPPPVGGTGVVVEPAILYTKKGEFAGYVNIVYSYEHGRLIWVNLIRSDEEGDKFVPEEIPPHSGAKGK